STGATDPTIPGIPGIPDAKLPGLATISSSTADANPADHTAINYKPIVVKVGEHFVVDPMGSSTFTVGLFPAEAGATLAHLATMTLPTNPGVASYTYSLLETFLFTE